MKKILSFLALALIALSAFAQTPEEIVARMEEAMKAHEGHGVIMTIDVKIPILGTMTTKTYSLGDKSYTVASIMGKTIKTWYDTTTTYIYDPEDNELEIRDYKSDDSSDSENAEMFEDITDGYSLKIVNETDTAWFLKCKKLKNNPDKDAPKEMELVVSKNNYYPVSLRTKVKGVTMELRGIGFGVSEEKVTFDINKYPGVKVKDNRGK